MKIINTLILTVAIAIAPVVAFAGSDSNSCPASKEKSCCPAKSGNSQKESGKCPKQGSGNEQQCPAGKDSNKDGKEKA